MIKMKRVMLMVLFAVCCLIAARVQAKPGADEILIVSPYDEQYFDACGDIQYVLDPQIDDAQVAEILLKVNHVTIKKFTKAPWEFTSKAVVSGYYYVEAIMKDKGGVVYEATPIQFLVGSGVKGDVIINGAFDCKRSPWTWGQNEGGVGSCEIMTDDYFEHGNYALISVINPSTANWHLQLAQTCPVDSGHTYAFSFMADAESEKTINIEVQINHDPWTIYWGTDVTIEGWNTYGPYFYTSDTTDYTCKFIFNVAANNVTMMLDEVHGIDANPVGVESRDKTQTVDGLALYQNYPNPFNMNTTIHYDVPKKAAVDIAVYNIQGQKVRSLAAMTQPAGAYSIQWDGTDNHSNVLPSGMYIYRVISRSSDGVQTVSKKLLMIK